MNQSVAAGIKGISRAVIAAVIAFVIVIAVCATTAFAQLVTSYNVDICVDGGTFTITTNETEPIEIISQANVSLSENDKLDITEFTAGKGGVIRVDKLKTVNIEYDKTIKSFDVYADTVKEALEELKISYTDAEYVNYPLDENIADGMVITLTTPQNVTVKADGESTSFAVMDLTVRELLDIVHITLSDDDYTEPSLDTELTADMTVKVYRVEYKTVTETEKIAYETVTKEDSSMYEGLETVTKEGSDGKAEVTYQVKYVNGKEEDKTVVSTKTIKKAKNKVIKVGTKKVSGNTDFTSNGVESKNGYTVGQVIKGKYTHYCACAKCGTGSGVTASGKKVSNGMSNPYYIACNWLPLGSVVNVDGVNYTVVDRGGSGLSKVGRIDIFTPGGHKAALRGGTGSCTLTIMRLGW